MYCQCMTSKPFVTMLGRLSLWLSPNIQRLILILMLSVLLYLGVLVSYFWLCEDENFVRSISANILVPAKSKNQDDSSSLLVYNVNMNLNNNSNMSERAVRIHYYNPPEWVGRDTFKKCPQNCLISFGKEYKKYSTSQFVIFDGNGNLPKEPPPKQSGQVWIYHSLEPPFLQPRLHKWNRKINWTISYRRDADFTHVYGTMLFKKVKDTERVKLRSNWEDKTHGNAWFVSHRNVPSRRAEFARKLNKSINVDIYSRTGPSRCPTNAIQNCDQLLSEKYKFYLSFENDLCRDYVTEKCFKIYASKVDVIPVVRGVPDYSIFAPPHSYIDTTKFNDISSLGAFQKGLANNQTEFENYFQWRKFYYNEPTGDRAICRLCAHAHRATNYQRLYENLDTWVHGDQGNPMCRKVTDIE
ncbi:alpha-(1,3)-fucosyltransferase C-like [Mizuhopecten yessoensis]|uniref:Fucosyltransferase n=1 Tax=Mizuhopecten yessoensis TaxID=6573 RepID=A0A210PJ59_MIZYE|nr:alpha-(1,3)-fucosyltransferase C-like [Mizuhopecten yessoensis]OWF36513.1 Alpha-(1,3)-fucosyltransferase C [Mizuhopecten yessoensis]